MISEKTKTMFDGSSIDLYYKFVMKETYYELICTTNLF
jgi:hypothetical protein